MGIPKFFRWISERYPLCSQLIQENRIPEFDNLYLDMNGIIHNCSHPNDSDIHFRMTEDQIFLAIFNYIDHLFSRIKPQKLFFLAVDGVAPRAKMNQQRARRFRTAKDNADATKKAISRGEELPKEPPFDSNCITPGTPFMVRLQDQLKYFINKKITEDTAWSNVEVILSGHEVPGEGEHKIMEYLRLAKSQPDWDPNVRHCLYGLDADLMMLGLLSHEPHFALLREEVTFGRSRKKASANLDTQSFFLMHLSLFREYIDAEFSIMKEQLSFPYDLERIIDDFILMAYFVGNDFLPNLPGLQINDGAMALMFKIYKKMLLEGGGYLNDGGKLRLDRCEVFLKGLGEYERELFQIEVGDVKWLKGKRSDGRPPKNQRKSHLVISKTQYKLYDLVKGFVLAPRENAQLMFSTNMPARDRTFIIQLSNELGINHTIDAIGEGKALPQHHIILQWDDDDDEDDEESMEARHRVLKRWDAAEVIDEDEIAANLEMEEKKKMDDAFLEWKREYYKEKLHIDFDDEAQMAGFIYHYVEGLQWVADYYYNGVASWEWFYPYHYGPKITDLINLAKLDIKFDIGRPFLPFEQLMGVLPTASNQHIPEAYRTLMTDVTSPIVDFYPEDFELDMNGKKADWEAVVKIPFIDEKRLIKALNSREKQLTSEERSRNTHGHSFSFRLDSEHPHVFQSFLPGVFPDISHCLCRMDPYALPKVGPNGFVKTLVRGARLGINALPGFPTLQTLRNTATLGFHGVTVFNMESPNESMIVSIENQYEGRSPEQLAHELVGKNVYIGWPFLQEAHVAAVVDDSFRYEIKDFGGKTARRDVVKAPQAGHTQDAFYKESERIEQHYSKRFGTIIGPVDVLLSVRPLKGMRLREDGSLAKEFADRKEEAQVALQTIISSVACEDPRFKEHPPPPIETEYPIGATVVFLGAMGYGFNAQVSGHVEGKLNIKLAKPTSEEFLAGLHFTREMAMESEQSEYYAASWHVAKTIGMSSLALSKVTSSLHVISKSADQRFNFGLNLKFESKKKKVLGYSRKSDSGWEFSQRAIDLIRSYKIKFPTFFSGLERKLKSDFYEDTDFFPASEAAVKMAEMKEWLKGCGVKDFDRVSLEVRALTRDVAKKIEARVDEVYDEFGPVTYKLVAVKNVPRQALLKPAHAKHRLSHQVFDLGDRVLYAVKSGSVPLATQGTVIGIEGDFLDVVFDQGFLGGTTLGDKCEDLRGLAVHKDAVLNLTHIQPPMEGIQPTQLVPINRPIQKFAMRSGGNAVTQQRQADSWAQKHQDVEPVRTAWAQEPRMVLVRTEPVLAPQQATQPNLDAGEKRRPIKGPRKKERTPNASEEVFVSTSGIQVKVIKNAPTAGDATVTSGPSTISTKAGAPRSGDRSVSGQQREASQPEQTRFEQGPHNPRRAPNGTGPRSRNISAEEELTQGLKNMLHIGGGQGGRHQASHHAEPQYGGYPAGPLHGQPMPLQHGQPLHQQQHHHRPPPRPLYQPPQHQPSGYAHPQHGGPQHGSHSGPQGQGGPQGREPTNLDVSRHILSLLNPGQSQVSTQAGADFSPYQVAASSTPFRPPQKNELVDLVKHKGPRGGSHQRGHQQMPGPAQNQGRPHNPPDVQGNRDLQAQQQGPARGTHVDGRGRGGGGGRGGRGGRGRGGGRGSSRGAISGDPHGTADPQQIERQ